MIEPNIEIYARTHRVDLQFCVAVMMQALHEAGVTVMRTTFCVDGDNKGVAVEFEDGRVLTLAMVVPEDKQGEPR